MVEEEKKMEEKKAEEAKEEPKAEEKKEPKAEEEKKEAEPVKAKEPPPPQDILLRVYMHCEGCARKVRKCLKGFEGVENVQTDCKAHKVVVKGEKADPLKVLERVQRKSHRQVELLSPIPKPPAPEESKKAEEKEPPKAEEKKEEPQVITVVLKVYMHCDACAQEIKRRILRMNGVENVEADLKSSLVTVRGVFETPKLVEYLHKRTGKNAVIVKQEPEKKEEEKGKEEKEEKKAEDGGAGGEKKGEEAAPEPAKEEKDGGGGGGGEAAPAEGVEEMGAKVLELKKNEFYYNYPVNYQIQPYPPRYDLYSYAYPPQIFSDENPNACSVM